MNYLKNKKFQKVFKEAKKKAEKLLLQKPRLSKLISQFSSKAQNNSNRLAPVWNDLLVSFKLLRAWISGQYKNISKQSLVLLIGALLYFLNPLDLLPDFLFGGFFDDVTVLSAVFSTLRKELDKFKKSNL